MCMAGISGATNLHLSFSHLFESACSLVESFKSYSTSALLHRQKTMSSWQLLQMRSLDDTMVKSPEMNWGATSSYNGRVNNAFLGPDDPIVIFGLLKSGNGWRCLVVMHELCEDLSLWAEKVLPISWPKTLIVFLGLWTCVLHSILLEVLGTLWISVRKHGWFFTGSFSFFNLLPFLRQACCWESPTSELEDPAFVRSINWDWSLEVVGVTLSSLGKLNKSGKNCGKGLSRLSSIICCKSGRKAYAQEMYKRWHK